MINRSSEPAYHALVDLFMILLLIFSSKEITSMRQPDVEIVIPGEHADQDRSDAPGDMLARLNLILASDGGLLIDGKQISLADLVEKARAEQVVTIYLQVDKDTTYNKVLEIIRQLDSAGLTVELG